MSAPYELTLSNRIANPTVDMHVHSCYILLRPELYHLLIYEIIVLCLYTIAHSQEIL